MSTFLLSPARGSREERERGKRGRKRERTECQLSTAATRELKTFFKIVFHFMADHSLLSQSKEFQAGPEQPGKGWDRSSAQGLIGSGVSGQRIKLFN